MSESWIETELKAALEEEYRPAPWLLPNSIAAVRGTAQHNQGRSSLRWVAGLAAALIAISSIAVLQSIRQRESPTRPQATPINTSQLPSPIPQPITRTSAGAQVAWISQSQDIVGVDPNGHVVARLNESLNAYGIWRSADGATIYGSTATSVTAYSALDGKLERTYSRAAGTVESTAFSPDGRWLALLLASNGFRLQLIDLQTGSAQELSIPGNASSGTGVLLFSADSSSLYALTDWTGPVRLTAFSLAAGKLKQTGSAVSGEQTRNYPACDAPAVAAKVIAGGKTLVVFCHMDGAVWFFDLPSLTFLDRIETHQPNPFWYSPIFTPDGQLLYLQMWQAIGAVEVIDLAKRKLLGPVAPPTDTGQNAPFAWLFTDAYAGGVASTVPISPDGLKLYEATGSGVVVLRVPDLKPIAKLAPGFNANEVWISGDGQTIYATSADGKTLLVVHADGSHQQKVNLPEIAGGFVASEHG